MIIYLHRHALAVDKEKWKSADSQRPLTAEGRKIERKVGKGVKHLKLSFDHILTSSYDRARDTALILAQAIGYKRKIEVAPELIPTGSQEKFAQSLKHYPKDAEILAVGHEPYLSKLIALLLGSPNPMPLELKKSGLCRIDLEPGTKSLRGQLKWFLSPKLIKKI